jgi:organic radical activating enzyme
MNNVLKCKYAWSHLDFLQGQYAPCFRFKVNKQHIAKMNEKLPSEVINSKEMKQVRQTLMSGEFPPGCFDCSYKESRGLESYRQRSLSNKSWDSYNEIDYTTDIVSRIHDLELKFSRTCNFLCRHCNSESNSLFEIVGKQHPSVHQKLLEQGFDHLGIADSPITEISEEIIDDLIKNIIPNIDKLFFSGGEPLYHLKHYQFLEKLIESKDIDTSKIEIGYNTNLSMIEFKTYKLSNLWKHFKSVHVTVSMDGTGNIFNYFRERGNYNTTVENIYKLAESIPNLNHFLFVCTSSAYHAFYADVIFKDLSKLCRDIESKFNIKANTRPTFVHTPGLDMIDLDKVTKQFIIKNLEKTLSHEDNLYNKSISEIITYLNGDKKNIKSDFREVAKLQDSLYNKDPFVMVPRIAEYVYNNKMIWE